MLLSVLLFVSSTDILAQQAVTPPSRANVRFNAKYPQQAGNARWQQTKDGYTATFTEKGRKTQSRYTADGQWVESQVQLLEADWQPPTREYINQNHKACWITAKNKKKLDEFINSKYRYIARDKDGKLVFMAETRAWLQMVQDNFPDIEFHFTSEF